MNLHSQRLKKLQSTLKQPVLLASLEAFSPNLYYYSGVQETPAVALITKNHAFLYSWHEAEGFENYSLKGFRKNFFELLEKQKINKLSIDEKSDAVRFVFKLLAKKIKLSPASEGLSAPREIKSGHEISLMKKAQDLTKKIVAECSKSGTENSFAGLMEFKARKTGFALNAFPPIVAVNENAAIPHHSPTNKKINSRDLLLVDCGLTNEKYCADYTTTFYEGKNKVWKDACVAVSEALKASAKKVRPGVKGKVLTNASLKVLSEYGFKQNTFKDIGLSLGHQLGLEVHEGSKPFDELTLKKGMAITIEPGLYFKKEFGVRFEDVFFVK
ncbi:aminopeptidase P family protein [Candidatus Micrarchaeota archaeon]|nr:aminopeptidase P family protein [Candidatus Micrarchaeota archaeon]